MVTALSLFYDPVWVQKHYDNMPKLLMIECSRIAGWNSSNVSDKLWTSYLRSPDYLKPYLGLANIMEYQNVRRYINWIYAPLFEIKPDLEKKLKSIMPLAMLDQDGWPSLPPYKSLLRRGGTNKVGKMPTQFAYEIKIMNVIINDIKDNDIKYNERLVNEFNDWAHNMTLWSNGMAHGPKPKIPQNMFDFYTELLKNAENRLSHKDPFLISQLFENNRGFIPLFIYDYEGSTINFLNWAGNPFA